MFYLDEFCHHLLMVLLNRQYDLTLAIDLETPRISSRIVDHADGNVPSATRKQGLDVEPYSSAILRPLTAACVFRDCSLRMQSSPPERQACRTLMRQAAIKWRRGLAMGDL